jgi:threonine synthase
VYNCPEGGDDLDVVISKLYKNISFKKKLKLSSVNSLNWGRIMMQTVHYFYGYLKISEHIGHAVNMVVPSGGFGNLCAGGLARKMGLPIKNLIVANNKNACLHRLFSQGVFSKEPIHKTVSSAIDILIPINFWRYLYFCVDGNTQKIKNWMHTFEKTGKIVFDTNTYKAYSKGFLSLSISDEETLTTMKNLYKKEKYLLDPHGGVAMAAAKTLKETLRDDPLICLATAHPAKFPKIIEQISKNKSLPKEATHSSIEDAKQRCQKGYTCDYTHLYESLINAMETNWELHNRNIK